MKNENKKAVGINNGKNNNDNIKTIINNNKNVNNIATMAASSTAKCNNQVPFCKIKCCACDFVGREHQCPNHSNVCGGDNVPTIKQWLKIYENMADDRNIKTGMLKEYTVKHITSALKEFKKVLGYNDDTKVSVVNRKTLTEYISKLTNKNVTKRAKCEKIGQAFARWVRREVEDQWVLPRIEMPEIVDDTERFKEPPQELLLAIKKWYRSLYGRGNKRWWNRDRTFAMFMFNYAMRPGDIDRLKWSNIKQVNGKYRLCYTPNKTRLSSKRSVNACINDIDYSDLEDFRKIQPKNGDDDYIFGGGMNTELKNRLNGELRKLGVTGSKGLYLLRKLCIHSVFLKHGREAASAISADNFDILSYHYLDPDAVDVCGRQDEL